MAGRLRSYVFVLLREDKIYLLEVQPLCKHYPEFFTFPVIVMCTQLVSIFWNKMAGGTRRFVFLLLEVHINHFCVQCQL